MTDPVVRVDSTAPTSPPAPQTNAGRAGLGDTPASFARDHGVTEEALLAANPQLKQNDVFLGGEQLAIPQRTGGTSATELLAQAPGYLLFTPADKPNIPSGMGENLFLRKVTVDPLSASLVLINGAQGNPLRVGMQPENFGGSVTAAEHALGHTSGSPFISASERPFGAANFGGEPYLIDTSKLAANGGTRVPQTDLLRQVDQFGAANPSQAARVDLYKSVAPLEGETLIKTPRVSPSEISAPSAQQSKLIAQAENIWAAERAAGGTPLEVNARAATGLDALAETAVKADRIGKGLSAGGKVLGVVGVAVTAYELEQAGEKSVQQGRVQPIAAEVVRQGAGWGGAAGGAWAGAQLGAAVGIVGGPAAVVTGAIGAVAGGLLGFFAGDQLAGMIDPK